MFDEVTVCSDSFVSNFLLMTFGSFWYNVCGLFSVDVEATS